jgi:hypothetical protein
LVTTTGIKKKATDFPPVKINAGASDNGIAASAGLSYQHASITDPLFELPAADRIHGQASQLIEICQLCCVNSDAFVQFELPVPVIHVQPRGQA